MLLIDPRTPGLDNFLESLGETAWLDNIGLSQDLHSVDGAPVSSGIVAALHGVLVKRTAVGRRLTVFAGGLLTKDQQAGRQHSTG